MKKLLLSIAILYTGAQMYGADNEEFPWELNQGNEFQQLAGNREFINFQAADIAYVGALFDDGLLSSDEVVEISRRILNATAHNDLEIILSELPLVPGH